MTIEEEGAEVLTVADMPPDKVLQAAQGKLDEVVVVGVTAEGELWVAASTSHNPTVHWLLARGQRFMLDQIDIE